MDRIEIEGGIPLRGEVRVGGAKNACLAMLPAALLTEGWLELANVPDLSDVATMAALLESLGAEVERDHQANRITVRVSEIGEHRAPYEIVRKMRASFLVLGPLLAREGRARVSLPGGCAIGERGVDQHLAALRLLGAELELEDGYVEARAPRGLVGARIEFPVVSVGATENALAAATLAHGETEIRNAAREPEIGALARLLVAMGARIEGIGTSTLRIDGTSSLAGASQTVIPDRVELVSHLVAAAITGGDIRLTDCDPVRAETPIRRLGEAGVEIETTVGEVRVRRPGPIRPLTLVTGPYPGFPTDLQAQFMALLALAEGESEIEETVFERRFQHVSELRRMGADIETEGRRARIRGVPALLGAPVMATDLRASMCLVLAGLAARGCTVVRRVYHLDRGYERLVEKLAGCGARIRRVPDE